jgi:hypothetical protein
VLHIPAVETGCAERAFGKDYVTLKVLVVQAPTLYAQILRHTSEHCPVVGAGKC